MPLYQFTCSENKCEKSKMVMEFIVPLKMYDAEVKCPKCGRPLVKMLSAPFFTIK